MNKKPKRCRVVHSLQESFEAVLFVRFFAFRLKIQCNCYTMSVLGIRQFFKGKSIFLTGSTGFVGKCVAAKLLDSCPEVDRIFLLIRAKSTEDLQSRFTDLLNSKVFEKFRNNDPAMLKKLIALHGDVTLPLCGLNEKQTKIIEDVQVVIHSAASINFLLPLAEALKINVGGTQNVLELSKQMKSLKAVVYVSTAYAVPNKGQIKEIVHPSNPHPLDVLECITKMPREWIKPVTQMVLKDNLFTYTFSKHLAENVVESLHQESLPVCIVRPGPVLAAYEDPYPGWNDTESGLSMNFKMIFGGIYHTVLFDKNGKLNITPLDFLVNTIITAAWRRGTRNDSDLLVYNCVPKQGDSISKEELIKLGHDAIVENPYPHMRAYSYPAFSQNQRVFQWANILFRLVPSIIKDILHGRTYLRSVKEHQTSMLLAQIFKPFSTDNWNFSTTNMETLNQMMPPEDRNVFPIDYSSINWKVFARNFANGTRIFDQIALTSARSLPETEVVNSKK